MQEQNLARSLRANDKEATAWLGCLPDDRQYEMLMG